MSAGRFETLRWQDGRLEMIDQRILPARIEYLAFDSAESVAEGIRSMVVRGAPAIGVAAAYGVALEALRCAHMPPEAFTQSMEQGLEVLAKSRPTAVNLFWALDRMRCAWHALAARTQIHAPEHVQSRSSFPLPSRTEPQSTMQVQALVAQGLLAEAQSIHAEDVRINREMGRLGAELLPDGARVLTHCNAGALATAGHGTALGVIRSAREAGKRITVFADETRPFLQGARLTAWELLQDGFEVTLITDNMAGHLMARGEIDAVIVGADRVAANGDVANKIGTYMVAVLARRHAIPFYVACPLSTVDLNTATGADIPIEERGSEEVTGYRDCQWAAPGVRVRNPAFDVTPAELVSALITEKAVVHAPTSESIAALMS